MKMKLLMSILWVSVIAAMSGVTAFAAGWQSDSIGWRYATNDEGTQWYTDGWQWIDGNDDGIAERFYFDANGYIKLNVITPDGCTVNRNGAWVVDGIVQTQRLGEATAGTPVAEGCLGDDGVTAAHELELGICKTCGKKDYTEYYSWFVGVWKNYEGVSPIILNADGTCVIEGTAYDCWEIYSSDYGYKDIVADGKMVKADNPGTEYFYARVDTTKGYYKLQYVYEYEPEISKYQRIINLIKYDQEGELIGTQVLFVRQ